MNHTKNYDLPQWELNDLIRMEDFNSAMTNLESGIDGAKAEAKAADAELQRQVNAANTKAENAQSVANEAKTTAQRAASSKPYVVGAYVGSGNADVTINLGFRPSFVIVTGMTPSYHTSGTSGYERYIAFSGGRTIQGRLDITDTGFIARDFNATYHPYLADKRTYEYIAFK